MPLAANFRENLAEAMELHSISNAELSRRSGVHVVTISRILNGHLEPSVTMCEKLAKAAKIRPEVAFLPPAEKSA